MKKAILIFLIAANISVFAQERLLTKKIVYTVDLTENKIHSSAQKDSIEYNYIVNKRFFWEAMDGLINDLKAKKLYLQTFNGDTVVWDSMINNLTKQLNAIDLKKYSKKDIQQVLENEIRSVKFMEEWTYNTENMLINKKITAFCPVIRRDSVSLVQEDLQTQHSFVFDMGWIYQNNKPVSQDTLLIVRNIEYTMPIYNTKPYHWWDNNLEAEYSIPFFDILTSKTNNRSVFCYETPDSPEPFSAAEIDKRKKHSVSVTLYKTTDDNNISETDTVLSVTYNNEDIDRIRFGEELYYDKKNHNFIKNVNYFAPVIRIFSSGGVFVGYYPMFYIRKR